MASVIRVSACLCVAAAALSVTGLAQAPPRELTIDAIYDPEQRVDFSGAPATNLRWVDDATYLQSRRAGRGVEWIVVDAASGDTTPLFDATRMENALAALPGITRDQAADSARSASITFNPARNGALVTIGDDLYFYGFVSDQAARLTSAAGAEEEATFSPNGRLVAFVRGHNLYTVDIGGRQERALTSDGSSYLLNGKLDWLYQEEIYGRGRFRGYWWSPDSLRIAFIQLDERPVPEYVVADDIPYRQTVEITDYPKAGDPNPLARLGVVPAGGGAVTWVDARDYVPADILIVDVDWSPASGSVVYQIQDREQTWLELNAADAVSGRSRRLLRETTKAWVNNLGSPIWLKDGSFLWFSERNGFNCITTAPTGLWCAR
jgi:dipeptidyl-peptidase-4